MGNVEKKEGYNQVCVWPGTVLGESTPADFEKWLKDEFGVEGQYLEEIETSPDMENGKPVSNTGGRSDLFFAIHDEDVDKFVLPKLRIGARWVEDVLADVNYTSPIYPKRVFDYCSWNKENLAVSA